MGGQAAQYAAIQTGQEVGVIVMELRTRLLKAERVLAICKEKLDPLPSLFASQF